ncbi:hypothetical protein JL721_12158 [Aureococcus anophagefferens]|nr:hypothetical protein JL721_12158 [Aureococcus anophagefferens]
MVEGHSVHRVATRHRSKLVGKTFRASSPNARFAEGAALIDGKEFAGIEAVGKNLFAWFGSGADEVCVHVHFGMAGNWAVFDAADEPETTATTRLRLAGHGVRRKLGEDPLRDDADPERLWGKVAASKKSIGALVMDQSCFTGPGNIYRAEILFKAGVHPDRPGNSLSRDECDPAFDLIWHHTVELLKRGYATGSILTVDKEDERKYGQIRRYIYNKAKCPKCGSRVVSWDIAARTAYACETCQPKRAAEEAPATPAKKRRPADEAPKPAAKRAKKKAHVPFLSHCAPEAADSRKTVPELRAALKARGAATSSLKADLVARLAALPPMRAAEDAAADKARAGERPSSVAGCTSAGSARSAQ